MGSDKANRDGSSSRRERDGAQAASDADPDRASRRGPGPARRRPTLTRPPARAVPRSRSERKRLLPEDYLQHAMQARSPVARANWAERGLAYRGGIDRTTKTMLLRQLYLAFYASGHYARAYEVAVQAVALGVLEDVVHQDCARAKQAAGDIAAAVGHLRLAARRAPPSRRAFHYWTLGAVLYLTGRHAEAIGALTRAARWGTRDKPLYQGHLALAKQGAGMKVRGLAQLIARLAACPAGQGYGRFVLGQLAYGSQRFDEARQYLSSFVARTTRGHATMALALAGELQMARQTLAAMREAS